MKRKHTPGSFNYLQRTVTYYLATAYFIIYNLESDQQVDLLELLFIAFILIYPHIAFFIYKKSGNDLNTEKRNLIFDCFIGGWFAAFTNFHPVFTAMVFQVPFSNLLVTLGKNYMKYQLLFLVGVAPIFLIRQKFNLVEDISISTAIGLLFMIFHSAGLSLLSYKNMKQLRENREEMKRQNAEIQKQNEEIREQRDRLDRLNKTKTRFFSIISHDLRNPMSALISFNAAMRNYVTAKYGEKEDKQLNEISSYLSEAADEVLALLDGLLKWAMKEEGVMPYAPELLDLKICVEENIKTLDPVAKSKSINLETKIEDPVMAWVDKNSLMTVLRNLTGNALKFTHENGHVSILSKQNANSIQLEIIDNGVGIPPEKMHDLFEINEKKSFMGYTRRKRVWTRS